MFNKQFYLKRAVLTALLFFVSSCNRCHRWHESDICGHCPWYNSSIVYYTPECVATGIGFEILKTCSGEYYFLILRSFPILEPKITVTTTCCLEPFECVVQNGGQRLVVPQAQGKEIFAALCRGEFVTVTVACYTHTIDPANLQNLEI